MIQIKISPYLIFYPSLNFNLILTMTLLIERNSWFHFQTYRIVFSSDDDGASRVEELEPGLGERVLPELLSDVVEVHVLQDNVLQVKSDGAHLRSGLQILDDVLGEAAWHFKIKNLFDFFVSTWLDDKFFVRSKPIQPSWKSTLPPAELLNIVPGLFLSDYRVRLVH